MTEEKTKLCTGCHTYKPLSGFKSSAEGFFSRDGHNHTCIECNHPKEWEKDENGRLRKVEADWPEDLGDYSSRMAAVGQNGNTGEHYAGCTEQVPKGN